jgi:regulator of replication initiation timing
MSFTEPIEEGEKGTQTTRKNVRYNVVKAYEKGLVHEIQKKNYEISLLKTLKHDLGSLGRQISKMSTKNGELQNDADELKTSDVSTRKPDNINSATESLLSLQNEIIVKLKEVLMITTSELSASDDKVVDLVSKNCRLQEEIREYRTRYALQFDDLFYKYKNAQKSIAALEVKLIEANTRVSKSYKRVQFL